MNKFLTRFCILLVCTSLAGLHVSAKTMKALWTYCVFYSPEKGPYLETYMNIRGSSVHFNKTASGKFQGKISVSIVISKDKTVQYQDKYNLLSPETEDTAFINFNFIDQQRILLPEGEYDYTLSVFDAGRTLTSTEKPFETTGKLSIKFPKDSVFLSDIELLESYKKSETENPLTRNGYDLVPLVDNYFPKEMASIKFYAEIYNANKVLGEEQFLVTSKIYSSGSQKVFGKSSRFQKQESRAVNALMSELNIEELPSGNYELEIAVLNKSNVILASKRVFFQRSGSPGVAAKTDSTGILPFAKQFNNTDSLSKLIKCLTPVSSQTDISYAGNVIQSGEIKLMQQYFTDFWLRKDSVAPDVAWDTYYKDVKDVNDKYKTRITLGCETERGRIYLKYGKPNSISESKNEPSAYPYEIWHYYKLANQSNRKFVFYNPDLVTNDYILLHSDATGEIFDNQWEIKLNKRNTNTNNFDTEKQPSHFGGKANDIFRNPK